ncbi:MAG: dihydrolipoamide acetyltransferase family protein [Chloroflexi bacterium]|nr:dihydrolipoamide acetyltransferase family protein [Chloroflexota bacterium]
MIIELPQVGESVTEGTIVQWLKQVGDSVDRYDPLVEVLTDKVSMEVPSPVTGVITEILAVEGETLPMGAPIASIQTADAANTDSDSVLTADTTPAAEDAAQPENTTVVSDEQHSASRIGVLLKDVAPVGPTGSGNVVAPAPDDGPAPQYRSAGSRRRRYSPAVQRLAHEHGIDLQQVEGTGINGRVTRKDVLAYIESQADAAVQAPAMPAAPVPATSPQESADEERLPLSPVRRVIAANMKRSVSEIPSAWSITEVDVSGLVRRRDALKDEFMRREGVNLTYLHFAIKAVAESLRENPLLNSSWGDDAIVLKRRINIGIAVAAPDGLVVPVLRDADTLSVAGIAARASELTTRARQGRLTIEDMQSGTFTLNNTGALGSVASQPIISHPQAAILTTEAVVKRPVVIGDAIAIRSMMNICLTFDHRIMDGAEASTFTNAVKRRLEAITDDTGIY